MQEVLPEPVLKVQNLSVQVANDLLINRISFSIQKGEIFALVGESGSGKSLTSLAIMRLLPEALDIVDGDIFLQKDSLFSMTESQMQKVRGRRIAMIFQEPMTSLNPVMKVGIQVQEVISRHLKLSGRAARQKVVELFEEVGIPDAAERFHWYPHQLSGGQKQRVMIAMALACEPDVLIADEPTTALDVTIQAQVLKLLRKIRDERQLSILFITHDMGVVHEMADTIAVMKSGKIIEQASKEMFFANPQQDYTQQLLSDAIPKPISISPTTSNLENNEEDSITLHRPVTSESSVVTLSDDLLRLDDIKIHFPIKKGVFQRTVGHVKAVDGVSLKIPKGKTLALVGESGSGKSTLGMGILKLVKMTSGKVFYQAHNNSEQELTHLSERQMRPLRRKIQVIFQDPFSALNPRMTIGEIIREGMVSLKVGSQDKNEQRTRVEELLVQVGLEKSHIHRYPHEFSGGQRQRIGIARALAVEPELIICDEPTSALDVSVRAQVLGLLKELQEKYHLSYLFITHDLSIIPSIAHEVAVMQKGKIVEQGPVEEVMCHPEHAYTQSLLASAPELVRNALNISVA
ncbi:dipeptide ABC transporter ATP-binding protein [Thiomicrorhabdus indica]|uniref:ABC transporter ATP-binding protein n=1 Tax=Thiomicrorhabdus indica TaxID=2267253 RepID=UPI002AA7F5BB|nr:dipeptide ABC transporter ATP-binding protein [Thiomicrorhabdus indica]